MVYFKSRGKRVKTIPKALRKKNRRPVVNDKRRYYREEYLKSEHWKQLKAQKLKLTPFCEECPSKNYLDVHHLVYKNLYDVTVDDLQTLCRRCHRKKHAVVVK